MGSDVRGKRGKFYLKKNDADPLIAATIASSRVELVKVMEISGYSRWGHRRKSSISKKSQKDAD